MSEHSEPDKLAEEIGRETAEQVRNELIDALKANEATKISNLVGRIAEGISAKESKFKFEFREKKWHSTDAISYKERRKYIKLALDLYDAFPSQKVDLNSKDFIINNMVPEPQPLPDHLKDPKDKDKAKDKK